MTSVLLTQVGEIPLPPQTDQPTGIDTQIVIGRRNILGLRNFLLELAKRFGQDGEMNHLEYFLNLRESRIKTPYLVLVGVDLRNAGISPHTVLGAVLIYEYRLLGCGTGIFSTDDTSGRRTMIAPAFFRMRVAQHVAEALMRRDASIVIQSFMQLSAADGTPDYTPDIPAHFKSKWLHTMQGRLIRSHLPLKSTMDETLADIGQRTRSNLRYYRRRAEAHLGCTFIEDVQISKFEFKAFNYQCTYPVSDERAAHRYDAATTSPGVFLCGTRDRNGRWLSILCARRLNNAVEIDWQMNRNDLPAYSLSTVLRSYFIEYAIAQGAQKMFIDGGTPHAIRFSFAIQMVRDLIVVKRTPLKPILRKALPLLQKFVNNFLPDSTFILKFLTEPRLKWKPWP